MSCSTYQTKQGHHEHRVMKNASFTPTECCLSCLAAHAVFWHDASSFGRWETRNTSTSLCQTPSASQGEALWWHSWQWQTDNGWMLHFTFLTFLWKCFFPLSLLSWRETKQKGWAWKEKTYIPPRTFSWRYISWYDVTGEFTACCSRTNHIWSHRLRINSFGNLMSKDFICAH